VKKILGVTVEKTREMEFSPNRGRGVTYAVESAWKTPSIEKVNITLNSDRTSNTMIEVNDLPRRTQSSLSRC